MAAKRKLPDDSEPKEVYVFKTEITAADVKETITKSFNFEIPDFLRVFEKEEIKVLKFKVGEKDFSIRFFRYPGKRGMNVGVYSKNKDTINVAATMKVAGMEEMEWIDGYYRDEDMGRFDLSLEELKKLAEENEGVLKIDVQITLYATKPVEKTVWKR